MEALEPIRVDPPAPEWVDRLRGLYSLWDPPHARGAWARDLETRLLSRGEDSCDRFYLIPYGDQVAAAMDVSRSAAFSGVGIVHRVFAHPTMRRRGLSRALMGAAKEDFRAARGRLLVLVAPETGPARRFYASQGFSEIVRASDGEVLFGWAARGRHVREAALRLLKHQPARWRRPSPGDWAGLVLWSALPGGKPGTIPETILDAEWIELFQRLESGAKSASGRTVGLEVGESRHGYVVSVRSQGAVPGWLRPLVTPPS